MTHREILEKAIQKAIDNGWKDPFGITQFHLQHGNEDDEWCVAHTSICIRQYSRNTKQMEDNYYQFELFIFSHAFAKALWVTDHDAWIDEDSGVSQCTNCGGGYLASEPYIAKCFEWHLICMVIADDPIAYLGANI